jgi:methylmalonyl-CoA/ethylmalonyl-CoA epimerase
MKKLALLLSLLPAAAPAQEPAYRDPGMRAVVQIAIVCKDVEATSKRWAAALGVRTPSIKTTRPGREVKEEYRGKPSEGQAKLAFINAGQVVIEFIQPVGEGTSWKEYLDKHGEGVQHIAFQVQDLDKSIQGLAAQGMTIVHRGRYDEDNGSYVYLDSEKALGVTLELLNSDAKKQ